MPNETGETVFDKASDADFWVNAGFFWQAKADALAEDARFRNLPVVVMAAESD